MYELLLSNRHFKEYTFCN